MKLAFVSTLNTPWGGSEELWAKSALLALKNGDHVWVAHYDLGTQPKHLKELKDNGAILVPVPCIDHLNGEGFINKIRHRVNYHLKAFKQLQVIEEISPDIIFINQGGAYNVIEDPLFRSWLQNLKTTYALACRLNFEYAYLNEDLIGYARDAFDNAGKVIFASHRNQNVAERQLFLNLKNAMVLTSPLNLQSKEIVEFPDTEEETFACVARLDTRFKGQDILIKALSSEKWKQRNWKLNLYGKGKDEKYLKSLTSYYGLEEKVKFHGHVNDIKEIWKKNKMLILCSLAEGTPISLQEAMICGRPAIATDVGGNTELVEDNVNGYISLAPTEKAMDEAIERAWKTRGDWEEMGVRAHEKTKQVLVESPEKELYNLLQDLSKN